MVSQLYLQSIFSEFSIHRIPYGFDLVPNLLNLVNRKKCLKMQTKIT